MNSAPHPIVNAFLDDDGSRIIVLEKTPDGIRERRIRASYTTYHRAADIDARLMRSLKGSDHVAHIEQEGERGEWVRVGWKSDVLRRMARFKFRDMGIECFEGDVDPVRYWLTQERAQIAKPRRCYLDIETDSRVSFAEKERMRVLCWAVSDEDGSVANGVLVSDDDDAEAELLGRLWKVLGEYDQVCAWFGGDPQNKESGFDFYVINQRSRRVGVSVDVRRWLWLDQLAVWRRMNQAESGDEKESMRLEDIAQNQIGEGKERTPPWVVERFGDKQLGSIAWELWAAGDNFRKLLLDYCVKDTELLRKLEARKGFLALFQSVCEATTVLGSTRGLFPTGQMDGFLLRLGREKGYRFATKRHEKDDGGRRFKGAFVLAPKTVESPENEDGGGWTKEQARAWRTSRGLANGILRDVHVCDFASLYPSNIITWNLSEDTLVEDESIIRSCKAAYGEGRPPPDGFCYSPGTGVVTRSDVVGILPIALRELLRRRRHYADEAKTHPPGTPAFVDAMARSTAYKVVANSFYGVAGAPSSRYFNHDVARSTTQNGVWLIKGVMKEGERRGFDTVAGDTDSAFIVGPSRDGFAKFVGWLNEKHLPKIISATGARESTVKLEFEKSFDILVFSGKKRYAARYLHYKHKTTCNHCTKKDGKTPGAVDVRTLKCEDCGRQYDSPPTFIGKPEIKGLEYRRGDWSRLAREMQGQVIDLIVGGLGANPGLEHLERPVLDVDIYEKLIEGWRERILGGVIRCEEVQISKTVRDDSEYKKKDDGKTNLEPQRVIAKLLESRGRQVIAGSKVQYVVVDGASSPMRVIPAEDFNGECDRFYLWDTMVYPPTQRLLGGAFPDVDWARFADVRPKKPRGKARKVPEGQLGFPTTSNRFDADELAAPKYSAQTLVVEVPEEAGEPALKRLRDVFARHPGARSVEIHIVLRDGARAVMAIPTRVATSQRLKEDVARAVSGEEAA